MMILDNPIIRIVLKAIPAFGLIDGERDSAASRGDPGQKRQSPFVLVARAPDGRWGVFERDFEKPLAAFDELQDACRHANELSKTRTDSMVLIGNRRDAASKQDSSMPATTA
jgi:hypothetical protein